MEVWNEVLRGRTRKGYGRPDSCVRAGELDIQAKSGEVIAPSMQPGNFRLTILIFPWDDSGASQAFARPDKLVQIANPWRSSLCEHWNCGLGCRSRPLTRSVTSGGQIPIPVTHGYRFPRFCQNSGRARFDGLVQFDSSFLKKRSKDFAFTCGARR